MDSHLLATKLRIPPQPHQAVHRDRLVSALGRGIPDYKLTLLSAPAGYGKTTILSQWARGSCSQVAWLSLGEEDNDFERFFRYLLRGWAELQPDVTESPLDLLLGSMTPEREAVLAAFVNVASGVSGPIVFVLDDYHLIEDPAIHQALSFLLEHLPPTIHFVLSSRAEPPLPLARCRARSELLEFRTEDLRFLPDETEDFLMLRTGLELSPDELVSLHARLEGWVAGLQLLSLTLGRQPTADRLAVSGRHRFIADYLKEDVLVRLPEDVKRFLLETSILDQLSGSLCDAVIGGEGGQEMLERLERDNLFLVPLDENRAWFRYHPLFADFLQEALQRRHPDEVVQLHRRAAHWYLAHDLPEQSLHHAVAGNDAELGIELGERYFEVKLLSGELKVLRRWLESLPEGWRAVYPSLGLFRAGVFLFSGAFTEGVRCVDEVEQELALTERADKRWQLARVAAIRCAVACFQNDLARAESYADSAFQELPEEDHTFRALIHHALGDTYRRQRRWEEARKRYLEVLNLTRAPALRIRVVHVLGALADLEVRQGRLRSAATYWKKAFAALEEQTSGRFPLPLIGWLYLRMGEILYEWNELEQADDYLSRGLERAELGGDARTLTTGYLLAGRLKLTSGEIAAASEHLERVRPLVENNPVPDRFSHFERFQAECWLAEGKLRAAAAWAEARLLPGGLETSASEAAHLAVARVLIVKGDEPSLGQALALLRGVLEVAEAEGRMGVQIEALALLALALWRRGEQASAMTALERALRLAEPEGYLRLFADLGLPMARLLQEARSRDVMPEYVETLLATFQSVPSAATVAVLTEPLTLREEGVLELLAAGLTNREIAERLGVSPETVKKHVGNLFAKLGVRNRTEAVAKARGLDLLA